MAHQEQIDFCQRIKSRFPHWFAGRDVLDCGSLDINGNNRGLFQSCRYTGLDIVFGNNVDVVSRIHKYTGGPFDTIISTEAFEHDEFLELSLLKITELLSLKGAFVFTCATIGRPEHGTTNVDSYASPGTLEYYRNVTHSEMADFLYRSFRCWSIEVIHGDLYGWGTDKR